MILCMLIRLESHISFIEWMIKIRYVTCCKNIFNRSFTKLISYNTIIKLDNGIVTNQFCETSIKDVFAAGDVSNFYHPFYERNMRLESYQHAQNHGICAGKNIAGVKTEYTSIPWMWSDQFNLNLQLLSLIHI